MKVKNIKRGRTPRIINRQAYSLPVCAASKREWGIYTDEDRWYDEQEFDQSLHFKMERESEEFSICGTFV